nr:MAG TPA: hypothetical protein [Caudoviricetes sp.]
MVSSDFIQSLLKRYSIYLFGGKCTIVVMNGAIVISCKQNDDGIEYTADYVFEYDGKETADLVGIDVKIVDTVNGVESYSIQSKNACYTYSTLQFIAQMITDNDLDSVHSADVIVGNE